MDFTSSSRRLPAEWEAQSAVQLTFPHAASDWGPILDQVVPCFVEIARQICRFEKTLIVCADIAEAQNAFGPNLPDNIIWQEIPSNDTWARDHGGICVEDDGKALILDFVFNGWGLKFPADKDNLVTRRLYNKGVFHADIQHGGIALEGGGIESDGQGTLLTTAECLLSPNRNPHLSKSEIETLLKQSFGLQKVLWLNHGYLAGDDTDSHIDTLARFCSPETIAYVKCTDPSDEHFDALQAMEAELKTFRTLKGEPYRLFALPWPDACYDDAGSVCRRLTPIF